MTEIQTIEIPIDQSSAGGSPPEGPPKEFRIFRQGVNDSVKGTFIFDDFAAAQVMAAVEAKGNDFFIDYGHQGIMTHDAAPAAGWFSVEMRNGELWATNARWTPSGEKALRDREYRHISPAFLPEPGTGRIKEFLNIGLTNFPAFKQMRPLVASAVVADPPENRMKSVIAALGLPEIATEVEVCSAVQSKQSLISKIEAITGKHNESEILGVISAYKDSADKVQTMSTQLADLESKVRTSEVDGLIKSGIDAHKINEATEASLRAQGMKDPAWLKSYLEVAPPVVMSAVVQEPISSVSSLIPEEHLVGQQLGIDPKEMAERKSSRLTK